MNRLLKKADIILIIFILAICSVFLIPKYFSCEELEAVIYSGGVEIMRVNLSEVDESYETTLGCEPEVTIKFDKNSVCFSHAECRDKLCVLSGALEHVGDVAACLPAGTVIEIEGTSQSAVDALTY